jgi:hypothetical protein
VGAGAGGGPSCITVCGVIAGSGVADGSAVVWVTTGAGPGNAGGKAVEPAGGAGSASVVSDACCSVPPEGIRGAASADGGGSDSLRTDGTGAESGAGSASLGVAVAGPAADCVEAAAGASSIGYWGLAWVSGAGPGVWPSSIG